jgi:hypothetical protein
MSEFIQVGNDDFQEIMMVLRDTGMMMTRDKRTKIKDEHWILFARIAGIVAKYDKRFQQEESATDSESELDDGAAMFIAMLESK